MEHTHTHIHTHASKCDSISELIIHTDSFIGNPGKSHSDNTQFIVLEMFFNFMLRYNLFT